MKRPLFPEKELVKNSVVLIASDAFGFDGLIRYTPPNMNLAITASWPISPIADPCRSKRNGRSLCKFLLAYGGKKLKHRCR
jgi:hypothetical protein